MSSIGEQFISADYGQTVSYSGESGTDIGSQVMINSVYLGDGNTKVYVDWDLFPSVDTCPAAQSVWSLEKDGENQNFPSFLNIVDGSNIVSLASGVSVIFMPDKITLITSQLTSSSGNRPEEVVYYPSQQLTIQSDDTIIIPEVSISLSLYFSQSIESAPETDASSWLLFQENGSEIAHDGDVGVSVSSGILILDYIITSDVTPYSLTYTKQDGLDYVDSKSQTLSSFTYILQNVS